LRQRTRAHRERVTRLVSVLAHGTSYIDPGSPWQNPWVESYGSRMRDEPLAIRARLRSSVVGLTRRSHSI